MGSIVTHSSEETIALGEKIARALPAGSFIALEGELGAGKTVFVKGLAKGLGLKEYTHVNSPSFVLIKEYKGADKELYHLDVYRLEEKSFADTIDFEKYFYSSGVTVVEWADKISDLFPEQYLEIRIEVSGITDRRFTFRAVGEKYIGLMEKF